MELARKLSDYRISGPTPHKIAWMNVSWRFSYFWKLTQIEAKDNNFNVIDQPENYLSNYWISDPTLHKIAWMNVSWRFSLFWKWTLVVTQQIMQI